MKRTPTILIGVIVLGVLIVGGALAFGRKGGSPSSTTEEPEDTPTPTATATPIPTATNTPEADEESAPEAGALPDLTISHTGIGMAGFRGGCVEEYRPAATTVCVRNQGAADAGTFAVQIGEGIFIIEEGLPAGEEICLEVEGAFDWAMADPDEQLAEADEENNAADIYIPTLTPPPLCTPVESADASPPTPTPTDTPEQGDPPADPCAENGGVGWTGEVCVCAGVIDVVTICADGTKIEVVTAQECAPDLAVCGGEVEDEGGGGSGDDDSGSGVSGGRGKGGTD